MRKIKIFYRDAVDPEELWETKPYDPRTADKVAENLSRMGCFDLKKVAA